MIISAILDEFVPLVVVLVSEPDVLADEEEALGLGSPLLFCVIQGVSKFALAVNDSDDGLFELLDVVLSFSVQLWDDLL